MRRPLLVLLLTAMAAALLGFVADAARAADPCAAPVVNKVACENTQPGSNGWDISPDTTIEGFTTDMSTNVGGTVNFKIRTDSSNYQVEIYRLGWYGGAGGRLVTTLRPSVALPQTQPACITDATVSLVDCGTWAVSASWTVPTTAVSGVYSAVLRRLDTKVANNITFVVRDDSSHSDMLVQTSDTTWQAYNAWGGANLYYGANGAGRANKVSYNRPLDHSVVTGQVFYAEYPLIRFIERNGYDVSYLSGVDTDRSGSVLKNHRLFVSSGHDEYWSGPQRANVEAAKAAGVDLAFLSGNEMWWRVRWENAVDGSNTDHRTLVCYKSSLDNAQTDPSGDWTGTWRDPRFSPAGVQPENALIGQMWRVNGGSPTDRMDSIAVPADLVQGRLWRNTAVAGSTTAYTLPAGTLGYEWDSQSDNGFQPAGVAQLSEATVQVTSAEVLQDYSGASLAPGTVTHHMTMYRDPASGALVFAAGTVQWAWGLDDNHDGGVAIANAVMQQATINLFADMHVLPATLMSGLVAAQPSTDTAAPTVAISSPAAGSTVTVGSPVTISGTATDSGVVAGVEVSVDGGKTWHPAAGRSTWSYSYTPTASGTLTVQVRAVDDSANLSTPTSRSTTVKARSCPCSIWPDGTQPGNTALNDDRSALELGTRFQSSVAGYIDGVRFFKGAGQTGTHTGSLWSASGQQLATGTFTNETASGWQTLTFPAPVAIQANTPYVASYFSPNGQYVADSGYFSTSSYTDEPLTAPVSASGAENGVYLSGSSGFPTGSFGATNYWVDVVLDTTQPADTSPPNATPTSPLPGSSSVPATTGVGVSFDEAVQPASVQLSVTAAGATSPVAGSVSYDATTRLATFQPAAPLAAGTTYTATLTGAKDLAGNALAAPVTWSFTTMRQPAAAGVCPCSVWDDTAVPGQITVADATAVELGMRFRAAVDGTVTGVRFYKGAQNTGTHTGTLWTADGQKLATATFSSESTAGWQQVSFAQPVSVTAGTTYVVSYHTDKGEYSVTAGGLAGGATSGPLSALADGDGGPNGTYAYGSGGFPSSGASGANYWVDVVFQPAADTTPPAVVSSAPAPTATGVDVTTDPSATFSEPLAAGTAAMTVTSDAGAAVPGALSLTDGGRTVVFRPNAPLAAGTGYTVTVSGAKDTSGNVMGMPYSWHFTTAATGLCPCTVFGGTVPGTTAVADDVASAELGVRIRTDVDGWITGVRFYKGTGNTGTHTGTLWSSTGQKLATGTFAQESASGWQEMSFAAPVAVTAGTDYVVSYHAPSGHYAADSGYFATGGRDNAPLHALQDQPSAPNGVYAYGATTVFPQSSYRSTNYWVDAVFSTAGSNDTTPPAVTSTTPATGATQVATTSPIVFTFGEPIQSGSAQVSVTTAQGSAIAGTVSYPTSTTVRFAPTAALPAGTGIKATVSGAKDMAGNVQATAAAVSFTTATPDAGGCPCTLFSAGTAPTTSANDGVPLELGVRFTADTAGTVSGVRFYKMAGDAGTHTGSVWAADGTRLATATFSGETASGWQQVTFDQPVTVQPGQVYTASFHSTSGVYAYTRGQFVNAVDSPPLHAPAATATAPNGVYVYGASALPTQGTTTGYWVDVVFSATASSSGTSSTGTTGSTGSAGADTTAPSVVSTSPAAGATAVPVTSPVTVTFSEPVTAGSLALSLTGPSGAVSGTVALDAAGTKATLTPAAALAAGTAYTVSARATDLAGNAMAAAFTSTFTTAAAAPPTDTTPPTVASVTPVGGATGVSSSTTVTATFSEPVVASSVTAVLTGGGVTVAGTSSWSTDGRTLTVKPGTLLSGDTTYTMKISGAQDSAGNTQATAYTWSFTTATPPTTSVFTASDVAPTASVTSTSAAELGMRVTVGQSGWVTGVRFYKGTGGAGQHVGSLWTTTGQRLAAVQFTNETASGWQVAQLSRPVAVTAGTTYVVSYTAPAGRWTQSNSYFTTAKTAGVLTAPADGSSPNGVGGTAGAFPTTAAGGSNFWVDVLFTTTPPAGSSADTVAPVVVSTTPSGSGQPSRPTISALFSEKVSGVTMTLTGPNGAVVSSRLSWSATLLTETLTPVNALAGGTTYTVRVSAAKDAAGNALAAPVSWTFTTA